MKGDVRHEELERYGHSSHAVLVLGRSFYVLDYMRAHRCPASFVYMSIFRWGLPSWNVAFSAVQTRPLQLLALVPVYRVFCSFCEYVTMQLGIDWTLDGLPTLPRSV